MSGRSLLTGLLVSLALLLGAAREASADGFYFLEGMGGPPTLEGELLDRFDGGLLNGRIGIGRRSGAWAFEGNVRFLDLLAAGAEPTDMDAGYSAVAVGLDVRRVLRLSDHLEAYARGGLCKTSVSATFADERELGDYAGRGITYGVGLQARARVPVLGLLVPYLLVLPRLPGPRVPVAAWFDWTQQRVRLHDAGHPSLDGRIGTWTIGFSIGRDL